MVNGLHLYSAFIQSAVQFMPLIHPFTHTFTHQRRLAAMQGTNQLVRSNWGLGVLLRDTSTRPGWDRTGNPPTARRLLPLTNTLFILLTIRLTCTLGSLVCKYHDTTNRMNQLCFLAVLSFRISAVVSLITNSLVTISDCSINYPAS